MRRLGFTLIELVFVIVIMGILSKFGVEFLAQAYNGFIFSSVNNSLQAQSATAVESIASRLQYRIKDSIIARQDATTFQALSGSTLGENAKVLEWIGSDIDGFRGNSKPFWSGVIDLYHTDTNATILVSPETNTTAVNDLIAVLANNNGINDTTINNAAIYFVGSDSDINSYGWDGEAFDDQSKVMHPIKKGASTKHLIPRKASNGSTSTFEGYDVYEYYQLAWTAYAVAMTDYNATTQSGTLRLYYDYQPWDGETYLLQSDGNDTKSTLIMENVSTFQFKAVGSVVKIQVCVKSNIINGNSEGGYSLCKEKTIY